MESNRGLGLPVTAALLILPPRHSNELEESSSLLEGQLAYTHSVLDRNNVALLTTVFLYRL